MKPIIDKTRISPSLAMGALHIFVLFSLTLSQPIFNLISQYVEFFVARQSKAIDIAALIILMSCIIPLIFVGIECLAELFHKKVRLGIHFLLVLSLVAALAIQSLNPVLKSPGYVILTIGVLIGIAAAIAYHRYYAIQFFFTILSPAILIFPILFIFNSPVQKLLFIKPNPPSNQAPIVEIRDTPPIVMVVFDELPITSLMNNEKQIDSILYPNFAALAQDSYWFRNTTAVSTTTTDAVSAILSGLYPNRPWLPNADGYPNNIFTLLGSVYDMKVYEIVTQLCPRDLCKGEEVPFLRRITSMIADLSVVYLHILLPKDLAAGLPVVNHTWKDFTTPEGGLHWTKIKKTKTRRLTLLNVIHSEMRKDRGEVFRQFVASINDTNQPTLYFSHSYLPHTPWVFLPSGKRYVLPGYRLKGLTEGKWDDAFSGAQAYQQHLLQSGFVDTLLGELIDKLKTKGLYDRSLIIITADHGISFKANDMRRGLTETNYQDIMPVPLFIKLPNQHEAVVDDKNVETIDILPTIADILNITLPGPVDGQSVFETSAPQRDRKVIYTVFRFTPEHEFVFGPGGDDKYKTLKRKNDLFGDGSDDGGLYTIGPYSQLIGKEISLKDNMAVPGVTVTIDNEDLYDEIDLKKSFIPAHITGRLHLGNVSAMKTVAIAVNGKISAVTRTFSNQEGETLFSAIAPESSFRSGRNRLDLFIISEAEKKIILSRVYRKKMISFSLSSSNGLTSSDGEKIRIVHDAILGSLDTIKLKDDIVSFIGWAAGKNSSNHLDIIAVFVNDTFFYSGEINRNRPDVAEYFNNKDLLRSGFHYQFSSGLFEDIKKAQIRIFGISKSGVASELGYAGGNMLILN